MNPRTLLVLALKVLLVSVPVSVFVLGCAWLGSPQAKTVEKDALRIADVACILEHSMFPTPAIETACDIEHSLAPAIEQLLASHKAAAKRELAASVAMPTDAGTKDGGADAWAEASQFGSRK